MKKIKIAFFDIDGTLVDNDLDQELEMFARVPDSTKQALLNLREKGIETVIATGRNKMIVEDLAQKLKIESVITSNGQLVTHKGEDIYKKVLSSSMVEQIVEGLEERNLDYLIETPMHVYAKDGAGYEGDKATEITYLSKNELPENVLQFICKLDDREKLDLGIEEIMSEKVAPQIVNIHEKGFNKATGIKHMLELLGISAEEAIAFGDEENDQGMFQVVGYSVAMGQGNPVLKEQADFITKSVGEGGIFYACEELGLFS
ncbi:MAG: Cof-type HAD-IIB family hydrolase [Lactobacillales bacterium]|nr:Cof-type HAD-IIB family hydrolase [Lactobacillales bacterium]